MNYHITYDPMYDQTQLIKTIDLFLEKKDMSPSTFGAEALNDRNFYIDLVRVKNPRSPTMKTVNKVLAYIKDHR